MTFWNKQPIKLSTNDDISIIEKHLVQENNELPDGFSFKTLSPRYLDEIYDLLNNHYIEDPDKIIRLIYPKDFLYWYLRYIPPGFAIGLIYKNKLVGMITALFLDMIIFTEKLKTPYINLLCIQSKIRKYGMSIHLINELKKRLINHNVPYSLFTTVKKIPNNFTSTNDYAIPINYTRIKKVGFLIDDIKPLPLVKDNPLRLMKTSDVQIISLKLNKFMEKLDIKPFFTDDSTKHFLLPKKNIVYTFVKYDKEDNVTDMISAYKMYYYCLEYKKVISVAFLSFYFYETMNITDLVLLLLDKLKDYGFDQLIFRNTFNNSEINITKFLTCGELNYYLGNIHMKKINSRSISFLPF
ncbi:putative N-myristoyltransferase [Acanthamoeba polyphaga moumouvirus]|uniref:glycylpeptide N-tetradecanoyltransferase n=1 Tax=Acanthamoeba polyphaga moumouvirus TaxID=1269028 RepID=L7RD37_9VIRU|nr:putative N-myristoyltransferase [Acanthamoeba polyphaga moumouvirus]AGC02181.1 putative N-myristoyltransferase [Acanthamoeba polyphaga moumouvirus]